MALDLIARVIFCHAPDRKGRTTVVQNKITMRRWPDTRPHRPQKQMRTPLTIYDFFRQLSDKKYEPSNPAPQKYISAHI
ncbi:hypothetical protein [Pseudomonas chlororaphis]|jgi:hypothetical protein|uniref:hypothetical protein n=1 Tax=Pseudomonas chlororaphis TaxID=587753 RepID=UPI0024088F08|nr:hypothetical protein [Pseudomonas chlororaphis]